MKGSKITRRKFVTGSAGAVFGAMIVPRHVLGGAGFKAPSDTLNFALVGAGAQGITDAAELINDGENLVALVDVDFPFVDRSIASRATGRNGQPNPGMVKVQEAYAKAARYADFREMLDKHKDIDGVMVATPDHTHAVIAKAAMELGKHVYVEKPLTYSVYEARVLRETAERTGVATQMGNMGHSSEGAALINEWIQAGIIGKVREVNVWTDRPYWPQGIPRPAGPFDPSSPQDGPWRNFGNDWSSTKLNTVIADALVGDTAVPEGLNWDLFLGPAPFVPYHPIYHPFNWRGWLDWGTGSIGDMAAHLLDHPYWALGLKYPTSIEATSTPWGLDRGQQPASYPLAAQIVYHFPARGDQPPVKITWNDGGFMPPRPEHLPEDVPLDRGGGVIFHGEKGILVHGTYGANPQLYPQSLMEEAKKVPQTYPRYPSTEGFFRQAKHRSNWAAAAKGEAKASTPFEYAGPLTETMLLGVVALRTGQGKRIYYDGEKGEITNVPEANQYLHREYRSGWSL
jgi:predicted dehydrogenase